MARKHTPATKLIGSKVAAEQLGLDRSHFNRLVRTGAIPVAQQLDGRTGARLFDPADIARFKKNRDAA